MSTTSALVDHYLKTKRGELLTAAVTAAADATTTIITAPAAGRRIVVVDGLVSIDTTGTAQWFETDDTGTAVTGLVTMTVGRPFALGPWILPAATALACETVTGAVGGTIAYFLTDA